MSWLIRLLAAVAFLVPTGLPVPPSIFAQGGSPHPMDVILTNEEGGGKDVLLLKDEDCSEARAQCAHRRWERDGETDASVGPIITVSKVWVARDVETARAIYREQEALQKDFPERLDPAEGPFKFEPPRSPPAEEWTGLSACPKNACESAGRIDVHQRMVARKGAVVSVVYLFGRERNSTPDLTIYFTTRMLDRAYPPPPPVAEEG